MRTVFRLLSLRYLVQRWDRAGLIVLSIALGVATLVSTRILNRCIEAAAANNTTPLGIGDLFVNNGEMGVERVLGDEIRRANIPGVESVQPVVVDKVYLPQQDNRAAVLLGVELAKHQLDPAHDPFEVLSGDNAYKARFSRIELSAAAAFRALSGKVVVLSRALHDEWVRVRASADAPLVVRYGGRQNEYTPVAVVDYSVDSPLAVLGPNVLGMEIDQAAHFLRPDAPRVNRIDVLMTPTADRAVVKAAVDEVVGGRAFVRTPEDQGQSTRQVVGGIQIGFTMCSVGAMVVGLFLVYNSLAVTVAERRHDIGILRSIGATRPQVVLVFLVAAAVLGLLGGAVGIPLGIGMARFALELIRDEMQNLFTNPAANPAVPTTATMLLACAAGLATALLAAVIPAVQAASQDPADAVRRTPGAVSGAWRVAHRVVCISLVASGVGMILTRNELPERVGAFGGMVTALVGLLLAAPIVVGVGVQMLHPLMRRVLSVESRLAADNLIRSPGRTGLVIGALGAGVAVMIQTAGVSRSNEEPVMRWLDEIIQADQFVAAGNVTEAVSSMAPSDATLVDDVARIPGVEAAAGIRYVRPEFNGTVVFLTAIDTDRFIDPSQKRGPDGLPQLDKYRRLPHTNGVLVSDNFAVRHGVRPGDTITLQGPNGPVPLAVLDTVTDFSWSQGTLFIDRKVYARLFRDNQIDIVHVFVTRESAEATQAARERVVQFAADRGYFSADRSALRRMVGDLIDRVYKLVHLQQIVVGIVAALGVVTSLLISVLQRKRELGLLLAVGATPAQVVRTVLAEAVLMGLFGTVLGFLIGLPLEWYVLRVVMFEMSGFHLELVVPWRQAAGIAGGAMLVATLAGLFPALRAVRTRIPDAIAYE
jgi:putative ABC transport system permease protein